MIGFGLPVPHPGWPAIIVTVMNHFCRGIQKGLKNDGITPGGFTGIVDRGWVVPRYVESLLFIKNHPSDTADGSKIRDQLTSWYGTVHIPIVYTGFSSIPSGWALGFLPSPRRCFMFPKHYSTSKLVCHQPPRTTEGRNIYGNHVCNT